jgi:hypothetical protein
MDHLRIGNGAASGDRARIAVAVAVASPATTQSAGSRVSNS